MIAPMLRRLIFVPVLWALSTVAVLPQDGDVEDTTPRVTTTTAKAATTAVSQFMTKRLGASTTKVNVAAAKKASSDFLTRLAAVVNVGMDVLLAVSVLTLIGFGVTAYFSRPSWRWISFVGMGVLVISLAGYIGTILIPG